MTFTVKHQCLAHISFGNFQMELMQEKVALHLNASNFLPVKKKRPAFKNINHLLRHEAHCVQLGSCKGMGRNKTGRY